MYTELLTYKRMWHCGTNTNKPLFTWVNDLKMTHLNRVKL